MTLDACLVLAKPKVISEKHIKLIKRLVYKIVSCYHELQRQTVCTDTATLFFSESMISK